MKKITLILFCELDLTFLLFKLFNFFFKYPKGLTWLKFLQSLKNVNIQTNIISVPYVNKKKAIQVYQQEKLDF